MRVQRQENGEQEESLIYMHIHGPTHRYFSFSLSEPSVWSGAGKGPYTLSKHESNVCMLLLLSRFSHVRLCATL